MRLLMVAASVLVGLVSTANAQTERADWWQGKFVPESVQSCQGSDSQIVFGPHQMHPWEQTCSYTSVDEQTGEDVVTLSYECEASPAGGGSGSGTKILLRYSNDRIAVYDDVPVIDIFKRCPLTDREPITVSDTGQTRHLRFYYLKNYDYPENDIAQHKDMTLEECGILCRNNKSCEGFTYNDNASVCFLKDALKNGRHFEGAFSGSVYEVPRDENRPLDAAQSAESGPTSLRIAHEGCDGANRIYRSIEEKENGNYQEFRFTDGGWSGQIEITEYTPSGSKVWISHGSFIHSEGVSQSFLNIPLAFSELDGLRYQLIEASDGPPVVSIPGFWQQVVYSERGQRPGQGEAFGLSVDWQSDFSPKEGERILPANAYQFNRCVQ